MFAAHCHTNNDFNLALSPSPLLPKSGVDLVGTLRWSPLVPAPLIQAVNMAVRFAVAPYFLRMRPRTYSNNSTEQTRYGIGVLLPACNTSSSFLPLLQYYPQ